MKPRILILTAGFGEGHHAAARAIAKACDLVAGPETAAVFDAFALAAPRWNRALRRIYLGMIDRTPRLWRAAYRWLDRPDVMPYLIRCVARETGFLRREIDRTGATVLCSTFPVYSVMVASLARAGIRPPPLFTVVTDSISVHSLWWRCPSTGWFVPNEDSAVVLHQSGLPPDRVQAYGFPVDPCFADLPPTRPVLALGATPRVLCIVNSRRPIATDTARRLLTHSDWPVTCAVGRDRRLQEELTALAARRTQPSRVVGWTDEIPRLLLSHHVVVSKAGGATTQEALAAGCPMLVNQIVPGQEEGNFELLRRHGVGAYADSAAGVLAQLQRAFSDRGRLWSQWTRNLGGLSQPNAARLIAGRLLEAAEAIPVSHLPPAAPRSSERQRCA